MMGTDDDFIDEALGGNNIFTSEEASEGLKKQAEALGFDPNSVDLHRPQKVLYAKKNCKHCFGRGTISFVPSPARPKHLLPGNSLGKVWNTCKPEPHGAKRELKETRPCRCVRTLEI